MNFLIINHYAGAPGLGMELRPYYFSKELIRKGHCVSIVASSYSHYRTNQPKIYKHFSKEIIDDIEYFWIKTPKYSRNNVKRFCNILIFLIKIFLFRKKISGEYKYDVIISSSTYPLDIFPSLRFAKKHKAKLLYEVHDLWPLTPRILGGYSKWHPFILIMQIAENFAYKKSDLVLSLLDNAFEYMVKHGMDKSKFTYLPNGIDPNEWLNPPAPENLIYIELINNFIKEYDLVIGYTGALGPANAMDIFIDAAILLKNESFGFIIIGKGQEKKKLEEKSAKLKLNNILFLEPINKKYLPQILSKFDILYLGYRDSKLYKFGICPNKLFDYMMASKPVILGLGHPYKVFDESGCGYKIKPGYTEQLAITIRKIKNMDQKTREKIGKSGYEYVNKYHSYEVLTEKLLRLLDDVVN